MHGSIDDTLCVCFELGQRHKIMQLRAVPIFTVHTYSSGLDPKYEL